VYARSYVREFAGAVGLQPDQVVRQLEPLLPGVDDPLPALREIARGAAPDWPDRIAQSRHSAAAALAGFVAHALASFTRRRPDLARWSCSATRCAAACLDAAALLLLLASVVQLTAWTSGADAEHVLTVASEQIAALWGLLVVVYFVILGGVGGRTPGGMVCGVPPSATRDPLRLRAILERAMLH
jgi:hypothetical protein